MEKLLFVVYFTIVPPGAPPVAPYVQSFVIPAEKCPDSAENKAGPIVSMLGYSYVYATWCEDATPTHPRVMNPHKVWPRKKP